MQSKPKFGHRRRRGVRVAASAVILLVASVLWTAAIAGRLSASIAGQDRLYFELARQVDIRQAVSTQLDALVRAVQTVGLSLTPAELASLQAALEQAVVAAVPSLAAQASAFVRGERETLDLYINLAGVRQAASAVAASKVGGGPLAQVGLRLAVSAVVPESISLAGRFIVVEALLRSMRVGASAVSRIFGPLSWTAFFCFLLGVLIAFDWKLAWAELAGCSLVCGALLGVLPNLVGDPIRPVMMIAGPEFFQMAAGFAGASVLLAATLVLFVALTRLRRYKAQ